MIIFIFVILTFTTVLLLRRAESKLAKGFILIHPFIYYFVFTEFLYEFKGSDVSFYFLGYFTLCIPLAGFAALLRWKILKKAESRT